MERFERSDRISSMERSYTGLDDERLLARARELAAKEKEAAAEFLACLAEIDRRNLAIDRGFPSLFEYCVRDLGYSESAAARRVRAVRAAAKAPEVLSYVATGELSLEAASIVSPLILKRPESATELLESAKHKSMREVERLVAERNPAPDKPDVVRRETVTATAQDRVHFSFSGSEAFGRESSNSERYCGIVSRMAVWRISSMRR